jgi:hypothetical protein
MLKLLDITKPTCVPDQTTNANLFYTKLEWLKDPKEFLKQDKLKAHYRYDKSRYWLGK